MPSLRPVELKKERGVECGAEKGGEDEVAFEVAHLPGIGPYALDSFRIFHRDEMRGLAKDWLGSGAEEGFEPEWMRVRPRDKELRAYLEWLWERERVGEPVRLDG